MFYDRLCSICKEKNVNITDLVKQIGMSSGNLSSWKSGKIPRSNTIQKIADHLEVSIDYLLDNEDNKKSPPSLDDRLKNLSPAKKKILEQLDQLEDDYLDLAIAQLELLINQQGKQNK